MVLTNNSFLADKVALRAGHLPDKPVLRVLDCYAGEGKIWAAVKKLTGREIRRLPVEINDDPEIMEFKLIGDNRAYLQTLDLSRFDVIDLDAYGVPYEQLEQVFSAGYKGVVFVTFIQTIYGVIPYDLLGAIGFSLAMIKKIPTLFGKSGWKYFLEFLSLRGVSKIWHRSHNRKHYLGFNCADLSSAGYNNRLEGKTEDHA